MVSMVSRVGVSKVLRVRFRVSVGISSSSRHGGARVGTARAHPTSARVGHEICTNSKTFFWRSRVGGSRLCMSLKVHHISSMNISQKCVCPLQIVYAYLAFGGKAPMPHWGSAPGPCWGTSIPKSPVPTLPPNSGYATEWQR